MQDTGEFIIYLLKGWADSAPGREISKQIKKPFRSEAIGLKLKLPMSFNTFPRGMNKGINWMNTLALAFDLQ